MRTALTDLLFPTLSGFAIVSLLGPPAAAQGSGSSRIAQPSARQAAPNYRQPYTTPAQPRPSAPRPPTTEEFADSLWRTYLVRPQSPYTQWAPLPGKVGLRSVSGAHGALVRLYANATARADPKGLPPGSILVLEEYAADRKVRTGINILYRVKGYDPKNSDWYWMKYQENGTLARTPPGTGGAPIAGRVASCIDCHRKAGGNDLVFSNGPDETVEEQPATKKAEETKGK